MPSTGSSRRTQWLLLALDELGGSALRADAHTRVALRFSHEFTADDLRPRRGREPAWRNDLDSLYDRLKKRPPAERLLEPHVQGQPWTLTPLGLQRARELRTHADGLAGDLASLANFRPGSSASYLTTVQAGTHIRSRHHEEVLDDYGRAVARKGWTPRTDVHPRDLELSRAGEVCLVEIKMVYAGNVVGAARAALAQLLEYRHFFYASTPPPTLLAVFSEDLGGAMTSFLTSLDIASVWRERRGWFGDITAQQHDLVP